MAAEQPLMSPIQSLAIDILFQEALAHHQAEVLTRAPPRRVGALVDEMAQIIEPARRGRLASLQPRFARLAALPGPRGETENLDLDAAALQGACQNIGASRCDRDRAPAHRSGIVDEQGHHGVAKLSVLFALER